MEEQNGNTTPTCIVTLPSTFDNSQNKYGILTAVTMTTGTAKVIEQSDVIKREMLEQLSTNALPPYVPDFSGLSDKEAVKTYCCRSCGDVYVNKLNLDLHVNRRSVLIHFNCASCDTVQVFYNRCRLLSHISDHVDKGQPSDISMAKISPLPRVLMEGIHAELMKVLENEEPDDDPADQELPTLTKLLEVSMSEDGTDQRSTIPVVPDEKVKKIRCSECPEMFKDVEERKVHFINNNKLPPNLAPCDKCGILCPTVCSLKAHKRLHLQISPYVCPECGDNPDRYWENFQKHLKYKCLHFGRSVGIQCSLCGVLQHTSEQVKKHILAKHTLSLVKCQFCPMAFKAVMHFHEHKKKVHGNKNIKFVLIFKCGICDVVFIGKERILEHLNEHVQANTRQFVFHCAECNMPYNTKDVLHEHMQKSHSKIYSRYVARIEILPEGEIDTGKSKLEFNSSRIECLLCHCAFSTHQGYSLHVTRSHSYLKYPCGICNQPLRLKAERVMHGKKHLRMGQPLCLLCNNKPIDSLETLDGHLRFHVECIKNRTICIVCGKGLFNFEEAFQHLRSEHYLKNPLIARVEPVHKPSTVPEVKIEEMEVNLDDNAAAKNDTSAEPDSTQKNEFSVNPSAVQKTANHESGHCYKCDFVSAEKTVFKEHILTHKPSPCSFQCMECGQCYVTVTSLSLHLKVHHRILDPDKYIAEEGAHHMPEKDSAQEVTKTNDLECSVCFETFESEALLKTHMRSHGLAFIQAKKAAVV